MNRLLPFLGFTLLFLMRASAELELPSVWPTSDFVALDATIGSIETRENHLQFTVDGHLFSTNKAFLSAINTTRIHVFSVICDSKADLGAFELLIERLNSFKNQRCSLSVVTLSAKATGSGIHLAFGNSKFEVKAYPTHPGE